MKLSLIQRLQAERQIETMCKGLKSGGFNEEDFRILERTANLLQYIRSGRFKVKCCDTVEHKPYLAAEDVFRMVMFLTYIHGVKVLFLLASPKAFHLKFRPIIPGKKIFPQFADGSVFERTYSVDRNGEDFRYLFYVISGKGEVNNAFTLRRKLLDGMD